MSVSEIFSVVSSLLVPTSAAAAAATTTSGDGGLLGFLFQLLLRVLFG